MPCLQQRRFVEEAARSVLEQGEDAELIVCDPGSSDGSRDVLLGLRREFGERLVLCFEPDAGQSDAVNRGLQRARAPILGWLNSDDRLRPGALGHVRAALGEPSAARWLYGRAGMIDAQGRPLSSWIARYKGFRGRRFSRWKLLTENFIPQMSVFWTRRLWETAGRLDPGRDLDMDYDLWLRFARVCEPIVLADVLADFRVHAGAKGSRRAQAQLAAALATAREHAAGMGWRARLAVGLHRVLSWRTRFAYLWHKPF
jgi:glycosyltransferase involved in cell wall biosynthesis